MKKKIIIAICTVILIFLLGGIYIIASIEISTSKLDHLIVLHQVEMLRNQLLIHINRIQSDLALINTPFARDRVTVIANARYLQDKSEKCLECHHSEDVKKRGHSFSLQGFYRERQSGIWKTRSGYD